MGLINILQSLWNVLMPDPPHLRNLSVPFLSQRKNTYVFKGIYTQGKTYVPATEQIRNSNDEFLIYMSDEDIYANEIDDNDIIEVSMANRSCNITCIAMILHYFGIKSDTPDTPDTMMREYFTSPDAIFYDDNYAYKSVMAFESWDIMQNFVEKQYNLKTTLYEKNSCTIQTLRDNIAAGYPVMISIGIEVGKASGHIAVVRGFTKIGSVEYIILNDPWGSPADINNELVQSGGYYAFYDRWTGNNGSNGDNVVLKVSEFKKMIAKDATTNVAMVIYANLWQKSNGKEISGTDAVFPMNADFMWHSGIHLSGFPSSEVRSIGAGKLLAVRNSNAINGSASFMLVKHQVAKLTGKDENKVKVGKILPFYALYMHTDSIKIEDCATEYFTKGKLPDTYNFKWLLQLFSNMLPHVYIIANKNLKESETEGLMNTVYKAQEIYKAQINKESEFELVYTTNKTGDEIPVKVDEFHGRRMLVHLLPVDGLFQELLDPEKYTTTNFQNRMLSSDDFLMNFSKKINNVDYVFFHSYDAASTVITESTESEIFCSIVDPNFFHKPTTVNKSMFKRNAKILSQLYNDDSANIGKVVSFNDLANFPVASDTDAKKYLDEKARNFTFTGYIHFDPQLTFDDLLKIPFLNTQIMHWNKIFEFRRTGDSSDLPLTDNVLTAMDDICEDLDKHFVDENNTKENISAKLKKYFTKYSNARYATLRLFLAELCAKNEEIDSEDNSNNATSTWRDHLHTILNDCFSRIQTKCIPLSNENLFAGLDTKTAFGHDLANSFVNSLKGLNLASGYREIAIEMACCRLCNIPKSEIMDDEYFQLSDTSISVLLESYSNFYSFQIYEHYVDAVIEISKNDIIGKSGRYNDEMEMIHFEIFSPKKINIYDELGIATKGSIVDNQKNKFFDALHAIGILKENIPEEDRINIGFRYLEENMILHSEFLELKESNIFSTYTLEHISEWSQTLTYEKFIKNHSIKLPLNAYIRDDEEIKPFHVQEIADSADDSTNETVMTVKDKDYEVREYFEKCAVPYHLSLEKVLGKKLSTNDLYIYYHPTDFLEQLIIKDDELFKQYAPKDKYSTLKIVNPDIKE